MAIHQLKFKHMVDACVKQWKTEKHRRNIMIENAVGAEEKVSDKTSIAQKENGNGDSLHHQEGSVQS